MYQISRKINSSSSTNHNWISSLTVWYKTKIFSNISLRNSTR